MDLVTIRENPEFALRTALSTMDVQRFMIFIGKEENTPSSNEKYSWHIQIPYVIAEILYPYQTTKRDLFKGRFKERSKFLKQFRSIGDGLGKAEYVLVGQTGFTPTDAILDTVARPFQTIDAPFGVVRALDLIEFPQRCRDVAYEDLLHEIWLYNTTTRTLDRVTIASPANRRSHLPSLSADGTAISFMSDSDFLGQGVPLNQFEIWLYQFLNHRVYLPLMLRAEF